MTRNRTLLAIFAAATFATQFLYAAKWSMTSTVDPITDRITYHVWAFGSELTSRTGEYSPKLVIRITPIRYDAIRRRPVLEPDVFLWSPAIKRKEKAASVSMILRFDDKPPTESTWTGSDNRCALFCGDPTKTASRILKSKKLAMRFTHDDSELTTVFNLDGLTAKIEDVKTDYLKRIGKYTPPVPGKKTAARNTDIASRTAPIGNNRLMRNQVRNQVRASIEADYDAQAKGYYTDVKNWLKSKRYTETKKQETEP